MEEIKNIYESLIIIVITLKIQYLILVTLYKSLSSTHPNITLLKVYVPLG